MGRITNDQFYPARRAYEAVAKWRLRLEEALVMNTLTHETLERYADMLLEDLLLREVEEE